MAATAAVNLVLIRDGLDVCREGSSVVRPQSGGFDTGAAAVRLPAIGRPSLADRISPMEPPRGVPVSQSAAAP
jgi:hypothetical protein